MTHKGINNLLWKKKHGTAISINVFFFNFGTHYLHDVLMI